MTWAYTPFISLPDPAGGSCQTESLGIAQSELSKSKAIPEKFCSQGRLTEAYLDSLFGTTLPLSGSTTQQRSHISAGSRRYPRNSSSVAGSRSLAKTSAQPEKEQESQAKNQGSGLSSLASLAKYDPDTCSWKIPQYSLLGDSELFLETWPRWGLMRDGECWEQKTLVHRTKGIGSGLWRTPTVGMLNADRAKDPEYGARKAAKGQTITLADQVKNPVLLPTPTANPYGSCQGGSAGRDGQKKRPSLNTMAAKGLWPTPRANDGEKRGNFDLNNPRNGLPAAAKYWPTPTASSRVNGENAQGGDNLATRVLGYRGKSPDGYCEQLNPDFVEWLMGWPVGWTDLDAIKPATADWEHGEPLDVPRTSTDTPNRKHRLMCIGNGQVPQCAAEAWRLLK